MAKPKKAKKLEDCSPEEILEELHARQYEKPAALLAKKVRPLAQYDSMTLAKALRNSQKLVYGMDDRLDLYQVMDSDVRARAESVVSLIDVGRISRNGDGTSTISTTAFGVANELCESERFREQPTGPHCSGFLVAPEIIATAGHCINQNNLARTLFVFGFRMINESEARVVIPNDDIFQGVGIMDRKEQSNGADYALVKLNRPATGRTIVNLRRTGKIGTDEGVYVIGHPSGLPLKYAPGAQVRDNSKPSYFVANLDTYGGNSGSPVFNETTGDVEGILVRGDTDFVRVGTCWVSNVCPTTGCRGEDITRTTEFADLVPEPSEQPIASIESRVANLERMVEAIGDDLKSIKDNLQ